jgi:hypothetical protein
VNSTRAPIKTSVISHDDGAAPVRGQTAQGFREACTGGAHWARVIPAKHRAITSISGCLLGFEIDCTRQVLGRQSSGAPADRLGEIPMCAWRADASVVQAPASAHYR